MSYHRMWREGGREWMALPGASLRDPVLILDVTVEYKSYPEPAIDWDEMFRALKMLGDGTEGELE